MYVFLKIRYTLYYYIITPHFQSLESHLQFIHDFCYAIKSSIKYDYCCEMWIAMKKRVTITLFLKGLKNEILWNSSNFICSLK